MEPLDGASPAAAALVIPTPASQADSDALELARGLLVRRCMGARGFPYDPAPPLLPPLPELPRAAGGYGIDRVAAHDRACAIASGVYAEEQAFKRQVVAAVAPQDVAVLEQLARSRRAATARARAVVARACRRATDPRTLRMVRCVPATTVGGHPPPWSGTAADQLVGAQNERGSDRERYG